MFGRTAKSWFYNCAKSTKRENESRNKWLAEIPSNQREKILEELDVNKVLSYLVYKRVFSLEEYKDIWSQESYKKRTEYFLDKLSLKGPSAFSAFCSILEDVRPNLLTCFLLGNEDRMHRGFPGLSEQTKLRAVSGMELHETCQMSDQEGSPSAEEQLNQSFNKYSATLGVKHQKENLTQSTQYFWRRESQVLVTICENYNLTFEENIAGSKANVPPACILHNFTHYKPQLLGPYQQENQSETESTIHKYNYRMHKDTWKYVAALRKDEMSIKRNTKLLHCPFSNICKYSQSFVEYFFY